MGQSVLMLAVNQELLREEERKKTKNTSLFNNDVLKDTKKDILVADPSRSTLNQFPVSKTQVSSSVLLSTFYKNSTFSSTYTNLEPFLISLSMPLPLTFRFRTSSYHEPSFNDDIEETKAKGLHHLSKHRKKFQQALQNNSSISKWIRPVSYDPTNSIYQAIPTMSAKSIETTLAKVSLNQLCPELKSLLVKNSANGCIARQEIGSMLPVLSLVGLGSIPSSSIYDSIKKSSTFLGSSHHLRILDMCASPGSKTLQALEQLGPIRGRIVANDVHPLRLQTLKDAIQRSGLCPETFLSRVKYTNEDASQFPIPKSKRLFDVILVDVPCSGDGTIRKEAKSDKNLILSSWSPNIGNALHELQVRILIRAMELIRVGGDICYSTCSLNPVEDEAVVAAAIAHFQKKDEKESSKVFELLDFPIRVVPGFVRRNGVHNWKIADYITKIDSNPKRGINPDSSKGVKDDNEKSDTDSDNENDFGSIRWHESYDEAVENGMIHAYETLWPLSKSIDENTPSSQKPPLEKCTRLFPQDQDTGGFFVALIRRLK